MTVFNIIIIFTIFLKYLIDTKKNGNFQNRLAKES